MFTAKVYKVMVGSLSGAMEEVYVAKETIRKWNQQNAEHTGKVFMPIEWGMTPEAIQNVDIVVAVIDNWVDNPTFVEDCVEAGKQVMLFFYSSQDSTSTISGEFEKVQLFMDKVQSYSHCASYNSYAELIVFMNEQLNAF